MIEGILCGINIYMKSVINMEEVTKKIIDKVNGTMTIEGMPLTYELIEKLRKCIEGESTTEDERNKILSKYLSR